MDPTVKEGCGITSVRIRVLVKNILEQEKKIKAKTKKK